MTAAGTITAIDSGGSGQSREGHRHSRSGCRRSKRASTSTNNDNTLTYDPAAFAANTIGLYNPSRSVFYLSDSNQTGYADVTFEYGSAADGDVAIAGDWTGDGTDSAGVYDPVTGMFYLKNGNSTGTADITFRYGPAALTGAAQWIPVVGDWDGDGKDGIGLYNPTTSLFYLRNTTSLARGQRHGLCRRDFCLRPRGPAGSRLPATGMATARTASACTTRPRPSSTCGTRPP